MDHLTGISIAELQSALAETDEKTPALRLVAAIAYKQGVTQSELAEWFDVERKTIYNWLTRLESRDVGSAIYDDTRPGRPRKLTDEQFNALETILFSSPKNTGFSYPAWTPELVQQVIQERFGVSYSLPSCRRLLKETGMQARPTRRVMKDLDPACWDQFKNETDFPRYLWIPPTNS